MPHYLLSLIPALMLAIPLIAEEGTVPQPTPLSPPGALPAGGTVTPLGETKSDMTKEIREAESQWRTLKDKSEQDPEVLKLKIAANEAQKAYRAKAEEVMVKDPSYTAIKALRDEVRAKVAGPRPGEGGQGKKKDKGEDKQPHNPNAAP